MKLNCKPGCLAIVVKGATPSSPRTNIGKVVTCTQYVGNADKLIGLKMPHQDFWMVDKPMSIVSGTEYYGSYPYCPDSYMRMLNDPDFTEDTTTDTKEKDHV